MTKLKDLDKKYVASTYARFPIEIENGKGSIWYGKDGREYIDMGSGIGVSAFGIADETWKSAVIAQIDKLQHTSNLYYTDPCVRVAELLCEKTGMKKVFFGNSGAEANECLIKAARKYAQDKKGSEYSTIITLKDSFHGRTITTLAATGQEHYHELFQPLTPGFVHAKPNDLEGLIALAEKNKTAAILIECIQGEGGLNVLDKDFVVGIEKYCRENDVVFAVDEVQTGNGRTGALYSFMNFGVKPDIFSTAKGLGGGLPIGACILGEKLEEVFSPGDHGSTFGGNPVCCAGAVSILERLTDEFLLEVREKGEYVFKSLEGADGVEGLSGMGLMIGIKTRRAASEVLTRCMERGVLCLTAKDKLRLLPSLNIPMEALEKAITIIKECCA